MISKNAVYTAHNFANRNPIWRPDSGILQICSQGVGRQSRWLDGARFARTERSN
jgi:hypothetical protein